jgi:hypothetical protein
MRVALLLALAASTNAFLAPLHPQRVNVELAAKKKKKKQVMSPSGEGVQATVLIEKADAAAADAMDLSKQAAALADESAAQAAAQAAEEAEREAAAAAAETAAKKAAADAAAAAEREKEAQAAAAAQKAKEEEAAREAESARLAAKAEAEARAKAEEEARIAEERRKAEEARIAAEKKAAEEAAARGDLVLAAAEAAASWPPDAAIGPLQDALAKAASLGITDGNDVDAAKGAIAAAERIAEMAKEGESVQPRRKAAAKAAEEWQVARKVEGLRAEGEKVISKRAEGAQKLQAYVKDQRASSIVGDWADADGMLCRLKADGTVLVCVEIDQ